MTTELARLPIDSAQRAYLCLSHSPFMTLPDRADAGYHYREAVETAKDLVRDFQPDAIVLFAPDHMNLLTTIRPPFTIVLSGRTLAEFDIPEVPLAVSPLAAELAQAVVTSGTDLAVAEDVLLDHGTGLTLFQLFDDPSSVPLIPIIVNAIGFPLFPVSRAASLGREIGAVLASRPERILFVGTGGLSHNPPFPPPAPGAKRLNPEQRAQSIAEAMAYVDPAWDEELLRWLADGDLDRFAAVPQEEIDPRGGGANEIRCWAAAWAAAGGPPAHFTAYEMVEKWITGMGVAFGGGTRSATSEAPAE